MLGLIARPYFSAAAVAGTAETTYAAAFPKTNLLNNDFGRVMRTSSGSVGAKDVTFDLGSAKLVDVLAFLWHNLRVGDTIQVLAGNTLAEANAGTRYNSGVLPAITGTTTRETLTLWKFVHTLDTAVTARYWTFRVNIGSAGLTYVQASRAVIGKSAVFAIGAQKATISAADLNQTVTMESGEVRGTEDAQLIRPIATLSLKYAKESEMAELLGAYTLGLGTSRPMLVCADITAANLQDLLAFGKPERAIQVTSEFYDVWEFDATVQSIGP